MLRHLLFCLLPPITLYFLTYTYFRQFWVKSQRSITLNNSKTRNGRVHICHSTRCWKSHLVSDNYDSRGHFKSEKPAETLLLWGVKIVQCLSTTSTKIHSARAKPYVTEKRIPNRRPKRGNISKGDVSPVGVAPENSRSHVSGPVKENYCGMRLFYSQNFG